MKEALLYQKLPDLKVKCHLCHQGCVIPQSGRGICGVRKNEAGTLYTTSYGHLVAANVDPIEKKPLFHFLPGSKSFSIAAAGCNFRCAFCQNADISQATKENEGIVGEEVDAPEIVKAALRAECRSISYTYTEPTIFFEFALDCAKGAKNKGLKNIFVTNGYISDEALTMLDGYLDAANIDLKSFRDEYYQKVCGARLNPVLENIAKMKAMGIWVEITTLVVPGENDSPEELKDIASFIAKVDRNIPWHISRFHPEFLMADREATPLETLENALTIGKKAGLNYVYLGNVPGHKHENTFCPKCNTLLIARRAYAVEKRFKGSKCPKCRTSIAGEF